MRITLKLIIVILTSLIIYLFTGCISLGESYSNADKYSAGNREFSGSEVQSLDIYWTSGKVTVSRHNENTVTVTETSDSDLSDAKKVHTWLDDDVLRIHFCKSGESYVFKQIEKDLEIKIPMDMKLEDLSFNGSSGDSLFDNIAADSISVDVSSGTAKIIGCSADTIDAEASSGKVIIDQKGESSKINTEVSSGSIDITAEKVGNINAECSSGNISINAEEAVSVDTEASSGKTTLRFGKMPAETEVDASSGDVDIYVPEEADFTADIDTSSGDFDSDLALSKDGSTYTSGNGENKLKVETSSGDVYIGTNK